MGNRSYRPSAGAVLDVLITLWCVPAGTITASPSRTWHSSLRSKMKVACPCSTAEELIDVWVDLATDLFARLQAHHDELRVRRR